jgi:hypothetical protein
MKIEIPIYEQILVTSLRPWMITYSDTKFKELHSRLEKSRLEYNPFYTIEYKKALTNKRKYYSLLIENERLNFLNSQIDYIVNTETIEEKLYLFKKVFGLLNNLLKKTSECINENDFHFKNINSKDNELSDNVYILHLLKFELILIYVEIQEKFKNELEQDYLTIEDLLELHFNELENQIILSKIENRKSDPLVNVEITNLKKEEVSFVPFKDDFRESKKGVLDYKSIVKNPSRFAQFETQLYENFYISEKYQFIAKHGQINELAKIYHILISKNFFNKRYYQPNKPSKEIKDLDIRKFLDLRYNCNVDKQFRTLLKNKQEVTDFAKDNSWLERILPC